MAKNGDGTKNFKTERLELFPDNGKMEISIG
jgi:hypothetical protein